MLPPSARLRRSDDFRATVRSGRRASRGAVMLHLLTAPAGSPGDGASRQPATVGFVVSKRIGGAVVRNRVTRRLRHLMLARLDQLPAASVLVVRALPTAAQQDAATLDRDLSGALTRLLPR